MSTKQTAEKVKQTSKETILREIGLQLSQALPSLKESLGEKKFEKRVRKAAKLLCEGIKPADTEKAPVTKIPAGKAIGKKNKVASPGKKAVKKSTSK
ncbi:MAG: hypothetical protein ABI760_16235 [Ferruginibacter sp.]